LGVETSETAKRKYGVMKMAFDDAPI
jgi:hypothetical protein